MLFMYAEVEFECGTNVGGFVRRVKRKRRDGARLRLLSFVGQQWLQGATD